MTQLHRGTMIFADGSTLDYRAALDGEDLHLQPEKLPTPKTQAAKKYFGIVSHGAAALRPDERRMIESLLFCGRS